MCIGSSAFIYSHGHFGCVLEKNPNTKNIKEKTLDILDQFSLNYKKDMFAIATDGASVIKLCFGDDHCIQQLCMLTS